MLRVSHAVTLFFLVSEEGASLQDNGMVLVEKYMSELS
jgi:hypothetical protein